MSEVSIVRDESHATLSNWSRGEKKNDDTELFCDINSFK